MKAVIFNVGGALSCYFELISKRIVVDLGASADFSPVDDFLKPYLEEGKGETEVDQLILSHPHDDHLREIEKFNKTFSHDLITTPNSNDGMKENEKIDWSLIKNPNQELVSFLKTQLLPGRIPPLKSAAPEQMSIHYIPAKDCESHLDLSKTNYANNISIAIYASINGHTFLFPGDLMKDGMTHLIKTNSSFKGKLSNGVDFLIAPHHGLRSSFSTDLFNAMKNGKTKRLNIVSEKITSTDSNRRVDSRYSTTDYCEGKNNLSQSGNVVYQRKTSGGHIYIDCSTLTPKIEILPINKIISRFK